MIPSHMEPHPVPQNVTSFEFHLIGDMTVKQFAYLASGLGTAYLTFVIIFPLSPLVAIPIMITSSLLGIALAFMPILDRPLDHWIKAYFRAIFAPTQGVWKPTTANATMNPKDPSFKNRLQTYLSSIAFEGTPQPLQLPPTPIQSSPAPTIRPIPSSLKPTPTPPPAPTALPSAEELSTIIDMAKQAQSMQMKIVELEQELSWMKTHPQTAMNTPQSPTPIPSESTLPLPVLINKKDANVKVIPAAPLQKKTQIVLTSLPNVVNGIVTDPQGNYIEGIIVITHNKEGLPVRALKTNKLGQFTGATPLPDGVYTVTLEKEGFSFDTLQITLDNKIISPMLISAKINNLT